MLTNTNPGITALNKALQDARERWKKASDAHVTSTTAIRTAEESLAHLQGLIAHETTELAKAQEVRRGSILASFGLGADAGAPVLSVADIQARIDALESVLPEHEAVLSRAHTTHATTDRVTKQAELSILGAKADIADAEQAALFQQFKAAHTLHLATAWAAGRKEYLRMDWHARIYGENSGSQGVPHIEAMQRQLINQAEQGE